MFVLDDLHWATKATLLLLRHLLRSAEPTRLLIVGTYRDTELSTALVDLLGDLAPMAAHHRVALAGLDEVAVAVLVERSAEEAAPRLVELLHQETQGTPCSLASCCATLAETGALHDRDHLERVRPVAMPESVREVIDRRLGACPRELAGRWLLRRWLDRPSRWSSWSACRRQASVTTSSTRLDEGVGARLVVETEGPRGTYVFAHARVARPFSQLNSPGRSRLHRAIGEALEELFEAGTIELPPSGTTMFGVSRGVVDVWGADLERLADHFVSAGQEETAARAVRYATLAARQAFDELALDEAMALLDRGRLVLDRAGTWHRALAADLYLVLAQAFEIAGDGPGHEAAAACRRRRSPGSRARNGWPWPRSPPPTG